MSEPQWCEHPGGGDVDEAGLCAWHRDAQPPPRTPDEAARAEVCVFCDIIAGRAPARFLSDGISSVAIEPINPVTPGHMLVIPRDHVRDAYENPRITAQAVSDAATWANLMGDRDPRYRSVNIITSVGSAATQTVFHLHVHVVPRIDGDGLALPWTGLRAQAPSVEDIEAARANHGGFEDEYVRGPIVPVCITCGPLTRLPGETPGRALRRHENEQIAALYGGADETETS